MVGFSFVEKYKAVSAERGILCTGFDTALPEQRKENVIPATYTGSPNKIRMDFALDLLEQAAPYSSLVKPNAWYVFGWTPEDHKYFNKKAHALGVMTILDGKIGDILDTFDSGLYWMKESGYDAFTCNPLPGNAKEVTEKAHAAGLGVIVLDLMSNPEAAKYMKTKLADGRFMYEAIAQDIKESGADGAVVGATVKPWEMRTIRKIIGEDTIMFFPGVGKRGQGGNPNNVIIYGSPGPIAINVGRDIDYTPDPQKAAADYQSLFLDALSNAPQRGGEQSELAQACVNSGVARIYRPNATKTDMKLGYVSKDPFQFSAIAPDAPCFGASYWDTRVLDSSIDGRSLAIQMADEEIGRRVDWDKVEFISTETTAGVPFAAWLATKRNLPLVVVLDKPQPASSQTQAYWDLEQRQGWMEFCTETFTCQNIDFVSTGTHQGLAFAAWTAEALNKPMFYMREVPKGYGKVTDDELAGKVEGVSDIKALRGKRVLNIDEQLGLQPEHVKDTVSELGATLCEYGTVWTVGNIGEPRLILGPQDPGMLKGKYGIHFTDLLNSGKNSQDAILAQREFGAVIPYCHFVVKRGDKGIKALAEKQIDAGANLDQDDIIATASERGMFTQDDMGLLDTFNANPRLYNERFLRTPEGHAWIEKIGERGKKIIIEGYPHLKEEFGLE